MPGPTATTPEFWFRASDEAYSNSDTATTMHDQSGNANDATGTPGIFTTNVLDSKPGIRMTAASSHYYDLPSIFGSGWNTALTFFFVGVDNAGVNDQPMPLSIKPDLKYFAIQRHTGASGWPDHIITSDAGGAATNVQIRSAASGGMCLGHRYNGVAQSSFYNGHARVTDATGNLGVSGTGRIGGYTGGSGFYWNGDICEVLIYNSGLTAGEENEIWDYLQGRYPSLGNGTTQILVMCDGDSLTGGVGATLGANYPYYLRSELGTDYRMINVGVPGQELNAMESDAATKTDVYFETGGVLVAWGGTNDLAGSDTAATVQSDYQTYCENRQSAGWKVVACTVIDRQNAGLPGDFQTKRSTFNTWLNSNWASFADAFVDLAADAAFDDANDTTYYDADKVHLNSTGYARVAELIAPEILGLASSNVSGPLVGEWRLVNGSILIRGRLMQ